MTQNGSLYTLIVDLYILKWLLALEAVYWDIGTLVFRVLGYWDIGFPSAGILGYWPHSFGLEYQ